MNMKYILLFLVVCVFAFYFGSKSSYIQQAAMYEHYELTGVENEVSRQVQDYEEQQEKRQKERDKEHQHLIDSVWELEKQKTLSRQKNSSKSIGQEEF